MNNNQLYRIRDLRKCYEKRCILHLENLDIYKGEIMALVGPSGAGKSTLLRMLNFLETPTEGEIEFEGFSFKEGGEPPLDLRRRVTTVFQRPVLLNRSVWDNVAYGLQLRNNRNSTDVIQSALEKVGLERLAKQRARTLSGGEAQRVALARALVLEPDVLLMDEPTANLDPANVTIIEKIASDLNKGSGTTLVLVTHNIFQAKRLAHRVVFLLEGQLIEMGSNSEFFNTPRDPRTKAFIGGEMVY
ncbi:MAG: phosphate ABC transporter ATP-binding protein [Anaerolineaceae bacterium]|nr:phosphate ABC transporter ATP-binding protein [Anaerolineaceae bacterium]